MILKLILGNPWIFGGIAVAFLLVGGWGTIEHSGRVAAEKGEAAARKELASAVERAQGNYDAAEVMKLQIEADKRIVADQNAEILRWKADSLALKTRNEALVRKGREDRDNSLAEIAAKDEEIRNANAPDTIHRLSPPVRALAGSLSSE